MTTIVLNTLAGAVTRYDWAFQSLTPSHAGDATGLYALGGEDDAGLPITARVDTGLRMWSSSLKRSLAAVFISILGGVECALTVCAPAAQSWTYRFPVRANGVSRCPVGKGIRENYLGFALETEGGPHFFIDRIEALEAVSVSRRS